MSQVSSALTPLALVGLLGCYSLCENETLSTFQSPGDGHTAIVFSRNCGATTGFNTQISLVRGQEVTVVGGGNIWVADDSGSAHRSRWGGPEVTLSWSGPDTLEIRYPAGTRVFKAEEFVDGVSVRYVIQ